MGQARTRLEHADTLATPALKLVFIINDDIYQRFPHLFQGLGTVDEAYQVTLKPNATPHALYAARNVPIPLRVKMEHMSVIYPIWTAQQSGVWALWWYLKGAVSKDMGRPKTSN